MKTFTFARHIPGVVDLIMSAAHAKNIQATHFIHTDSRHSVRLCLKKELILVHDSTFNHFIDIDMFTDLATLNLNNNVKWELLGQVEYGTQISMMKGLNKFTTHAINILLAIVTRVEGGIGRTAYCDTPEKMYTHRGIIKSRRYGI